MRRTAEWLRRMAKWLGTGLGTGLVAAGHCLGSYTTPECYGFIPPDEAQPADGSPGPGHPERVIPLSALPPYEQALWQQLEELWQQEGPGPGFTTRRP